MNRILYTYDKAATIEYDSSVPCLIDTIKEFLVSEELRSHLNKGLELLIEKKRIHGQIGWIADTRFVPPIFEDDLKWIAEDWTLRAEKAGIRHIAMVMPKDYVAQMNLEVYQEHLRELTPRELVTGVFKDLESAREWLQYLLGATK